MEARKFAKIIVLSSIFFITHSTIGQIIRVDPTNRFQRIEGWGSSLAWWANIVGGWPQSELSSLYSDITSPDELNMNIFKYNIPGGDNKIQHSPSSYYWFQTMYGYPTHFRWDSGDITSYKPSPNSPYDWSANANQRKILLELMSRRNDEILEAISYSPPYWMTISGCSGGHGGGLVPGQPVEVLENIAVERVPEFTEFLTDIVRHYHDSLGVTFKYISPLNEPTTDYWTFGGGQEGCKVNNPLQQVIIRDLHQKIKAKGMDSYTSINVADDTSIDQTYDNLVAYHFAGDIMSKIGKVATHTYGGTKRSGVADLLDNVNLWQSEVGGGDANYLDMSEKIILDLKKMHATAWINWQIVSTSPSWGLYTFDSNGLSGLNSRTLTKQKSYYGHKQFSKYIKSGYQIIRSTEDNSLAALSPDKTELVLILINRSTNSQSRVIDLSPFNTVGSSSLEVVRTSPTENTAALSNVSITNKSFTYSLPGRSITTFKIPVTDSPTPTPLANGTYKIKARHSNKFMGINGYSNDNAALLMQFSDNPTNNIRFEVKKSTFDYTIKPIYNNKFLSINQDSRSNGASIIQYDNIGVDNQRFYILPTDNNYYKIISKHSYLNLAVTGESQADGATIVQWQDLNSPNFEWEFVDASLDSTTDSALLPPGLYRIKAIQSDKYMSVDGLFNTEGALISQQNFRESDQQKFILEVIGNEYKIIPRFNDMVLSIENGTTLTGGRLQQSHNLNLANQRFYITQENPGVYKIRNKNSNLYLGVELESINEGARIIQWQDLNTSNFTWEFEPIPVQRPLEQGSYIIRATHSKKFMTVGSGNSPENRSVEQKAYLASDSLMFLITQNAAGHYKFKSATTNQIISLDSLALQLGTPLTLQSDSDRLNQQFNIKPMGNNQFKIISKFDENLCFSVLNAGLANGDKIILDQSSRTSGNLWEFVLIKRCDCP